MESKESLIKAIKAIDKEAVIEKNPRRPFDNHLTLKLYELEVIRLIERQYESG